ncbi:hypothetical protein JCM8097_007121 [Rhodosporidiobolus ruineniae]
MSDIYAAFSDQLRRAQAGEVSVLDDHGLVARWGQLCDEQLQALAGDIDSTETDIWTLERNTWALVQALYAERLNDAPAEPSSSKNPYTPPLTVVQRLIEGNKDLIELSAIRDWLHSIPSSLNPAEIRRGYLPYTKNKLKQLRRTGAQPPKGLVGELDPDAVLRAGEADGGARLEGDDAAYERALLRSLYEYVRAGELDLALDMCRQSDQAWRAASLAGGKLWFDPALAPGEEGYEEDVAEKVAQGNVQRRLWKRMCRKVAESNTLDPYERALYGALSGDVASVLPVCSTWEDVVWAHLNALFEAHVEAGLSASPSGRYWQRPTISPLDEPKGELDAEDALLLPSVVAQTPIRQELERTFEKLVRSDKADLASAAKNPFHLSQAYLIVGKIGELVETFVERLESSAAETEPDTLAHLLRFFSHLILALRLLKQPLPSYASNRILEAYVKVLEAEEQDESLVAFYASALERQSAVESYAQHLLSAEFSVDHCGMGTDPVPLLAAAFGPQHDLPTRHSALLSPRTHGLSIHAIAVRTVELLLSSLLSSPPAPSSASRAVDLGLGVSAEQERLVWGVEWLLMEEETYEEGLRWANALARYFLSTDAPSAARLLLSRLPSALLPSLAQGAGKTSAAVQLDIREHLDYVALFGVWERAGRWGEGWARRGGRGSSKLDQAQYRDTLAQLVDDFYAAAVELLEGEWLKLDGLDGSVDAAASRRQNELAQIRRLVVPDLVFRLHQALYETREVLPENLARCLSLANLVADERYQLYLEFVPAAPSPSGGEEGLGLKKYLAEVAKASLASLEEGLGPFGVGTRE